MPPANDQLTAATVLDPAGGSLFGNNVGATNDTGHYDAISDVVFGFGGSASVWYKLAVPGTWSATTSVLGVRAQPYFDDTTYFYNIVVGVFDFTTFPPATAADTVFLVSGYPTNPGNLFPFSGTAPSSGFWYVGVGTTDNSFNPVAFTLSWQFSEPTQPQGVCVSFDGGAFNASPFWTRLD